MDRRSNFTRGAYDEDRFNNHGFFQNEELHEDRHRIQGSGNYQGIPERDYGDNQASSQRDYQSEEMGYNDRYGRNMRRDDGLVNRTYDDSLMDERYAMDDENRDGNRPSTHGLQSRHWPEIPREQNDSPDFTDTHLRRDGGEHFDDISYPYQHQELGQNHDRGYGQSTRQNQPEHYLNYQDSHSDVPPFKSYERLNDRPTSSKYDQLDYRRDPYETTYISNDNGQELRELDYPNRVKSRSSEYLEEVAQDYDNQLDGNSVRHASADRSTKYAKKHAFNNGHRNNAYYDDMEYGTPHVPRLSRAVSQRRRSRKKSRKERRQEIEDDIPVPFVDGMKTLIQRRKSMRQRRPLSELGAKSELGRMSYFNDGQFNLDEEDEDKLPSNRNVKKTKSLKNRLSSLQRERPISVHDMATLLRDQVLTQEPSRLKGLNLMKYKWSMNWVHFKNWCKNVIYELELWSGAFKIIEGHFGTSTVSYFRFLRWLMFLNIFMSVFMLGIVLLPFLLLPPQGQGSFISTVKNKCESPFHYQAVYYSDNYTSGVEDEVESSPLGQKFLDVLQGTGWLENTVLFYGSYYNKTGFIPLDDPAHYNMSLAYLCGVGVSFLLSFVLLVKNSAKGFKQSAGLASSGSVSLYCNKVFGAWDFCISQQNTAQLKYRSILQEFKNELEYQRFQWKRESRTTREKLKLYVIRLTINVLVVAILGGALYLIFFSNQKLVEANKDSLNSVVALMFEFLPSITLMLLSVIVPTIFNKLVVAEDYMPAFAIRITLIRIVLLRLASLGMLMVSLYTSLKPKDQSTVDVQCGNLTVPIVNNTDNAETKIRCWETYVGQQLYKLVVFNFLVVIGSTYGWEFPRKVIFTKFHEKLKVVDLLGQQIFDLSKSVLDLVYLQTLCWLGMFFCPILPVMCAVTLFIFFYVKKGSLLTNCLPQQQYGTTKSNSLFMMVLLLSFFLAAIPITYMIGMVPPSQECGPYRIYSKEAYIMFDAVSDLVLSFDGVKDIFKYVADGPVMIAIGFFLCLLMYYFWIVGQANYNLSKSLREQLKVEGQDKQFLVARLNEALKDSEPS